MVVDRALFAYGVFALLGMMCLIQVVAFGVMRFVNPDHLGYVRAAQVRSVAGWLAWGIFACPSLAL
jgi:hypothetical protein